MFIFLYSECLMNISLQVVINEISSCSCTSNHTAFGIFFFLPSCSAKCLPLSVKITRSSSMSHLLPTKITWALSQEYVLI